MLIASLWAGGLLFAPALTRAAQPWWDHYPLIVETNTPANAIALGADSGFSTNYADPSWGPYVQKTIGAGPHPGELHQAGLKFLAYYEAFGTATSFILELGNRGGLDYDPVHRFFWSWPLVDTKGGTIRWAGPQNYFDTEDFCGPYTRLHPLYGAGGRAMTYPDGTVATGFVDNDRGDPRKSRVIDASCSKDLLGNLAVEYAYADGAAGNPQRQGGLLTINVNGTDHLVGHFSFGKDAACPMWADQQRSSILFGIDQGQIDGIWADNFSPWDNFGYPPVRIAFGDWSVALFRTYLAQHFTSAQLSAMGITNVATFDIRGYLRTKAAGWGGDDTNLNAAQWNDSRWLTDPVWTAYKIYKRQTGTAALTNYYQATKSAGAQLGKPDFAVLGNDIPVYSLGYARGDLDLVSSELTPGWHMGTSTRGFMLPPVGRFAPYYKLGREHAKSRLMNVWMYLSDDTEYGIYRERPGAVNTLYYEMLANQTLPMLHNADSGYGTKCTQNFSINSAFFSFVKSARETFGARDGLCDIGLYYSTSSVLHFMTPAGFYDMDNQPHTGAYNGWGTALGNLHCQYRALPEWKLTGAALSNLRVLIIPQAEVLDSGEVDQVIDPWVRAGGRLIVTGNSGAYQGETSNFDANAGLSLANLTGVSSTSSAPAAVLRSVGSGKVYYVRNNIGLDYFNASTADTRQAKIAVFQNALTQVLAGQQMVLTPISSIPDSVGLNVYADASAKQLFVDVNNYNLNLNDDSITSTPTIVFSVQCPGWLPESEHLIARVLTPGPQPMVNISRIENNRIRVQLGSIDHYASIVLTSKPTSAVTIPWMKQDLMASD
jgi:hypothetical protein